MDQPLANINSSSQPHLVAAYILDSSAGVLRLVHGWHWFDAISYLSSGGSVATAGHFRSQRLLETKRG